MTNENQRHVWTWADQISTYTFWGLLLFMLFSTAAYVFFSSTFFLLSDAMGIRPSETGVLFFVIRIAGFLGILLGWIIMRFGNIKIPMIILALIQGIGCFLLVGFTGKYFLLPLIGAGLWGLGYFSMFILIPSIIAGGRGGMSVFAGLYVIFFVYENIQQSTIGFSAGYLLNLNLGFTEPELVLFRTVPVTQIIIGIVFLLPIKSSLFEGVPKDRIKPHKAHRQDAFVTLLLNLIPFYALYFMYKIHGDLASFTRSPKLLSKRGAFWISFLFSVTMPITTTNFQEVVNEYGRGKNIDTNKKWLILLFTILFFPVAAALIQADLNRLIANKESS